jgi:hypothetical protein
VVGGCEYSLGYFISQSAVVLLPLLPEATCGIFIIDLPGTGRMIIPVFVVLSFLGMGWGCGHK